MPRTRLAQFFAASLFGFVLLLPPCEFLPALLCLALPLRVVLLSASLGIAVGLFGLRPACSLVFACGFDDGCRFCGLAGRSAWVVYRAVVVGADGEHGPQAFAVDDDGWFGGGAGWLGAGVLGFDLPEVTAMHGSGPLFFRSAPVVLDLHELGTRGNGAVEKVCHLDLVAIGIETLVTVDFYVGEEQAVVSAAARAGNASSSSGVQGRVLAIKRRIFEREIEVALYPCGEVFRRQQVRFLVIPVLAPALLEGCGLGLLRKPGDEVGVAGGDAILCERFGHFGNQLQEREPGVDVAGALAELVGKRGHIVAGHVEQAP